MTVRNAEKWLRAAGYEAGYQDGVVSPRLTASLKMFQRAYGMRATGKLDATTLRRLQVAAERKPGVLSVGQRSEDIKAIEAQLRRLGYDPGAVDGVYSLETAKAVRAFKADQGFKPAGAIGEAGRATLAREVKAVQHAPRRDRVAPTRRQDWLDTLTAQTATKPRAGGRGLREGMTGQSVKNMQERLVAAGFDPKRTDGVFDERTAGALKNFQRKAGLAPTGRLGPKTWAMLKKSFLSTTSPAGPAQSLGEKSSAVKTTEELLAKAGFGPGPVDGLFSRATETAVKAFQAAYGFAQTGTLGEAELAKLQEVASLPRVTDGMRKLADNAWVVAMHMGGFSSTGLCATGVSRAIEATYGVKVWGDGNTIDDNLPRELFREVSMPIEEALKVKGAILTWESMGSGLGAIYGHTAISLGDGHTSASDYVDSDTVRSNARGTGLRIFIPVA